AHLPPADLCRALLEEVARFAGGELGDDQTVVVLRRTSQ
ncbi:MAG: SpoIIE family protein phosphatase, partial [Armatimonadetes bacterium]|nr:SpoIIE family protein phosphatase [Armatimonadota bacterium]